MFSLTKIFLFAAALISLVVATNNNLPAPIRSSRLSQPYRIGTSQDAGFASNSSISANARKLSDSILGVDPTIAFCKTSFADALESLFPSSILAFQSLFAIIATCE